MSPRGKKASVRSPRRKAGRVAKRVVRKVKFKLTVDAQDMLVEYTPDRSGSDYAYGHFEFRSPYKPSRGIPVSRTGYLSQCALMADIDEAVSPEEFARQIVDAILNAGRKTNLPGGDLRQLSLF